MTVTDLSVLPRFMVLILLYEKMLFELDSIVEVRMTIYP